MVAALAASVGRVSGLVRESEQLQHVVLATSYMFYQVVTACGFSNWLKQVISATG